MSTKIFTQARARANARRDKQGRMYVWRDLRGGGNGTIVYGAFMGDRMLCFPTTYAGWSDWAFVPNNAAANVHTWLLQFTDYVWARSLAEAALISTLQGNHE